MKAEERRSPRPVKHQLDHELPTVIHHPEEEMPLLARWLDRAMQNQTRFWGLIGGVVVIAIALSVLGSGLSIGRATSDEAWTKLETAKTPGERVEIAKEFPRTPAERWALLQAASEYYNQGFNDLPSNREAALPNLKKALDLFQKVAEEAEPNSIQARVAALGEARTLEARNDRAKALARYDAIASNKAWAGSDEARDAARYARILKSPEAKDFYERLYTYKAPTATLPPSGGLDFPLPSGHPPIGGAPGMGDQASSPVFGPLDDLPFSSGTRPEPNLSDLPPPPPTPDTKASPVLPDDVFAPAGTPAAPK